MKRILSILFLIPCLAFAQFPVHSNTATVDVSKVTGDFNSFAWNWIAGNSQAATVYMVNGLTAVDMTGYNLSFKMARQTETGRVEYIVSTNITIALTYIAFTVDSTNAPPPATYNAEILGWQGSTNLTRSLFQGMVNIAQSLFP